MEEEIKEIALVGIVPRKDLWPMIQREGWYHIPVKSAPKNIEHVKCLAFYFPDIFDEKLKCKVCYYADVKKVDIVKRIELFPRESGHKRSNEDYYKLHLEEIKELPKPIPSKGRRKIVHIPTTSEKLFTAEEINDLWNESPLEDKMYLEMKNRRINTERQWFVKVDNQNCFLDFSTICKKGKIDIECDGKKYHTFPEDLTKDRKRDNRLVSCGWHVLRFSGKEINHNIEGCFRIIERTIENLGGQEKVIGDVLNSV